MVRNNVSLALVVLGLCLAPSASADFVNVYQIGSTGGPCGTDTAYDPAGNCIHGTPTPTWTNNYTPVSGDSAFLTIVAEGIDNGSLIPGGEVDEVYVNGTFVGDLTQQSFYSSFFNLSNSNATTGPLDLDGDDGDPCVTGPIAQSCSAQITDRSVSTLNVTAFVHPGANTIEVMVDPTNWVDEIDTSSLQSVPEPASVLLIGAGLLGSGVVRKRLN